MPCTLCERSGCPHSSTRMGVTACPECEERTVELDPVSGPKWQLGCNTCRWEKSCTAPFSVNLWLLPQTLCRPWRFCCTSMTLQQSLVTIAAAQHSCGLAASSYTCQSRCMLPSCPTSAARRVCSIQLNPSVPWHLNVCDCPERVSLFNLLASFNCYLCIKGLHL